MKGKLIMNNYCINLKKERINHTVNEEIRFSLCRECNNKEYKKSTSDKKSPVTSGQMGKNAQSLCKICKKE